MPESGSGIARTRAVWSVLPWIARLGDVCYTRQTSAELNWRSSSCPVTVRRRWTACCMSSFGHGLSGLEHRAEKGGHNLSLDHDRLAAGYGHCDDAADLRSFETGQRSAVTGMSLTTAAAILYIALWVTVRQLCLVSTHPAGRPVPHCAVLDPAAGGRPARQLALLHQTLTVQQLAG